MTVMITVILFGFGLIFGSFVNALVWRLHEREGKGQRAKGKEGRSLSILHGRSMCPQCRHTLAAKDLVPVLSWLELHGRCRYCRRPISVQYPIVELLTGLLFVIVYLGWEFSPLGLHLVWLGFALVYTVFFVALAVYDAKWFLLPDKLVFPLTGIAFIARVSNALVMHDAEALIQSLFGAALLFALFWALHQKSKGTWIGGGDVKLAVALGLIAGTPLKTLLVLFLASLVGTIASVSLLTQGREGLKRHIPFGPYLLAGCFVVMLFGERIVTSYTRLFL